MFRQKYVESAKLLAPPIQQFPGQHLDFRPPEHREPPTWWQGERCGECGGGGGLASGNLYYQWWKNISHDDDLIPVQMVQDETIVGRDLRKFSRCEVDGKILNSLQLRRLAGQLMKAADLLDGA